MGRSLAGPGPASSSPPTHHTSHITQHLHLVYIHVHVHEQGSVLNSETLCPLLQGYMFRAVVREMGNFTMETWNSLVAMGDKHTSVLLVS